MIIFMALQKLIDYFLYPKKSGYDVPKTLAYGIVLVLAIYGIYELLKKLKVKIDAKLAVAISPYIVFGGIIRVMQDAGMLNSYWFVTPGIYIFVFGILISAILVSVLLQRKRKIEYQKPVFIVGLLLVAFTFFNINIINFQGLLMVAAFYLPWIFILRLFPWSAINKSVTGIQMLDATATFVSLQFFGYAEQHIVPTLFINVFSPVSFIFLKVVGVVAVLVMLDRYSEDKEFNRYLKLIIAILGAATGTRDVITLSALV